MVAIKPPEYGSLAVRLVYLSFNVRLRLKHVATLTGIYLLSDVPAEGRMLIGQQ